jgi:hypothetical protein
MSFIFDHQNWEKLYVKNCSLKTQAEWSAEGYANVPLGILYSGLGVLCMVRNLSNYENLKSLQIISKITGLLLWPRVLKTRITGSMGNMGFTTCFSQSQSSVPIFEKSIRYQKIDRVLFQY